MSSVSHRGNPLTDVAPAAQGSVWYANSGGSPTALTPGTSGQVLQTNGANSAPSWTTFLLSSIPDTTINIDDYGAVGDGETDDRAAIQSAISALSAQGGGTLWIPERTYLCGRSGSNSYCLLLSELNNIRIAGIKGRSTLKAAAGLPGTSVSLIKASKCNRLVFDSIVIDGNWGNGATKIANSSHLALLPQGTITVDSTADFPTSGTFVITTTAGVETVTYTGKTATAFTGCTGGTGRLVRGQKLGVLNANTGINHTTQADPQNHGMFLRGNEEVILSQCSFKNVYGDGVWLGNEADANNMFWARRTAIYDTRFDLCGRNGITVAGGAVEETVIGNVKCTNIYGQAIDSEPQFWPARDVHIYDCSLDSWFVTTSHLNAPLSIVGGNGSGDSSFARDWRVENTTIYGTTYIERARGIRLTGCKWVLDYAGPAPAAVVVELECDDIQISDFDVYSRAGCSTSPATNGAADSGAIVVYNYATGTRLDTPAGVKIHDGNIRVTNARNGIVVASAGGQSAYFLNSSSSSYVSGTATGVSLTTLTDSGQTWTVNGLAGYRVRVGTAFATVASNTNTVLTLQEADPSVPNDGAWVNALGAYTATPAAGAYEIFKLTGLVDIDNVTIDGSNDGNGRGYYGVFLDCTPNDLAGMRCRIRRVTGKNLDKSAIGVKFHPAHPEAIYDLLDIQDCYARDDQATATTDGVVEFINTPSTQTWVLANNYHDGRVTSLYTGLSAGVTGPFWMEGDKYHWAGYGTPNGNLTAPISSIFRRVDGTAGSLLYVNQNGGTTWAAFA